MQDIPPPYLQRKKPSVIWLAQLAKPLYMDMAIAYLDFENVCVWTRNYLKHQRWERRNGLVWPRSLCPFNGLQITMMNIKCLDIITASSRSFVGLTVEKTPYPEASFSSLG